MEIAFIGMSLIIYFLLNCYVKIIPQEIKIAKKKNLKKIDKYINIIFKSFFRNFNSN